MQWAGQKQLASVWLASSSLAHALQLHSSHNAHCGSVVLFRRPGEVLIKVAAASINPIDFKMRGAHGGVPKFAITLPKVNAAPAMCSSSGSSCHMWPCTDV